LSLISDDDALPRGDHGREALNAYQSLISTQKGTLRTTLHTLRDSAESVLRSQEDSGKRELSRFAREVVVIAFNARSGPVPLPHRGVAVTG